MREARHLHELLLFLSRPDHVLDAIPLLGPHRLSLLTKYGRHYAREEGKEFGGGRGTGQGGMKMRRIGDVEWSDLCGRGPGRGPCLEQF